MQVASFQRIGQLQLLSVPFDLHEPALGAIFNLAFWYFYLCFLLFSFLEKHSGVCWPVGDVLSGTLQQKCENSNRKNVYCHYNSTCPVSAKVNKQCRRLKALQRGGRKRQRWD